MLDPEALARYESARARRRSELRQQRHREGEANAAQYAGFDADRGLYQIRLGQQFLEADSLTTGGLSLGDRAEGAGGFLDATPRSQQAQPRKRSPRRLQSFVAAVFYAEYQYRALATAYEGTPYARYKTWIGLKEAGKDLIHLELPWRGQPVFGGPAIDTVVGFNGSMSVGLRGGYAFNLIYVSRNVRIAQLWTGALSPIDPSLVDYPVRVTRQANETPEAALLDEAWGFYSSLYTFKITGTTIERLEVTRDVYMPPGQRVVYSDWWADYRDRLFMGSNHASSVSNFPDYDARSLIPGGLETIHRGRLYKIRKPKDLATLVKVKRLLLRNEYQVGSNRPIVLLVEPSELNIPENADLRTAYVQSSGLQPFTTWLASSADSAGYLMLYEKPSPAGPLPADRFWTFELGGSRFFGFAQ